MTSAVPSAPTRPRAVLPVVLVTALNPEQERLNGLNAGADDFLSKPIHQAELLARVRSLLRVKTLYDEVQRQRAELLAWNRTLEQRVAESVQQLERVGQLKRFFSPQLAQAIIAGGTDDPLKSHRREITVVFLDLRGFTAFMFFLMLFGPSGKMNIWGFRSTFHRSSVPTT